LASPQTRPRDALGVAALAEMKEPGAKSASNDKESTPAKTVRMRRSVGGRSHVLYVRLTEDEDRQIRYRAAQHGFSPQRFLTEAALSGSAESATARRQAALEVQAARVVLKGMANNLNQLAKWANANHVFPDGLDRMVRDLARAVVSMEETAAELANAFELGHQFNTNGASRVPT
jgi:plasmid stability protein